MVKIDFYYKDKQLVKIDVYDHAGSGDYGFDLVCAGISAITIGALNAFHEMKFKMDLGMDPSPRITFKSFDALATPHLEFLAYQLKTIEENYKKYVQIRTMNIKEKEELR